MEKGGVRFCRVRFLVVVRAWVVNAGMAVDSVSM